ncbi:hypothetical protein ES703_111694 [subsurface metagenome]
MGTKTKKVVRTVVTTGVNTSRVPSTAASRGVAPNSLRRFMFSEIIIPSSTIIPITRIIEVRERISRKAPNNGRRKNTPITDTGIPMATQKAVLRGRKMISTSSTKTRPMIALVPTI